MSKGMSGHQSAKSITHQWLTPPPVIAALGEFDLDPCSPIIRPWNTALNHYNIIDDGLSKEWKGRVWMNPPYETSQVSKWMRKISEHGNGTALIPARTETKMFFREVWGKADSVFFFEGRLWFYTVEGVLGRTNAGSPSVLVAYGRNNVDAIESSGLKGNHQILRAQHIIVVGISATWIQVVRIAVNQHGDSELRPVYEMIERIAPDKVTRNAHWREKVRQKVQEIRKQNLN